MTKTTIAMLALGVLVGACGDRHEDAARQEPPAALPGAAEQARAQREADDNRKRFLGDGKSKYTPQRVDGF